MTVSLQLLLASLATPIAMMGMGMDFKYMLFVMLPGMALSGFASWKTKSTFKKYSQVAAQSGMTGAQAAQSLLDQAGITDVSVEPVRGFLSDHYHPTQKALRLSEPVYGSTSLSAIGVACHEAGHAIQHATAYKWLGMRSTLVPATQISSKMAMPALMIGLMLAQGTQIGGSLGVTIAWVGVALFAVAFLFSAVTLPVEWDATARAKKLMVSAGIVTPQEENGAGKVLNAAFLTYLAAAISALLTVAYFAMKLMAARQRQ